jgi:hypothetical protein
MNVLPAAAGTIALTYNRREEWFDLNPVLAFELDTDVSYSQSVWVPDNETGRPTTLYLESAAYHHGEPRIRVLHPPVQRDEVLRFVDNCLWDAARHWFDEARKTGAVYESARGGGMQGEALHALFPLKGDRWLAPPEADDAIEAFNLRRSLALAARRGDTSPLVAAAADETWCGCLGESLLRTLETVPLAQTGRARR